MDMFWVLLPWTMTAAFWLGNRYKRQSNFVALISGKNAAFRHIFVQCLSVLLFWAG
jgi:hypothetical protein